MAEKRKYWGVVAPLPAALLTQQAQQLESLGLEGLFAPQVYGPPFAPLAVAAAATTRVKLATGIAIATARSPFETAMAAIDLDRISGGRAVLGLGTSVQSWSGGFFGMPSDHPVGRMRETIDIVRQVVAKSHTGELRRYDGRYYRLDFSEFQPLGEPVRAHIPIWVAALRGALIRLGAEVADGVIGHPMWSIPWATKELPKELERGLRKGGRSRSDVHVNIWQWLAPGSDEKQAIEDARPTVAFYAGVAQYEDYFAAHGFRDEARRLQEGVQRGDYRSVASLVPDEMVRAFVVTGTPDEVRAKVEPLWDVADSLCFVPPTYALDTAKLLTYGAAIAQTFYG
jgi:probable F420-dependent oxidoreductase